MTILAVEDYTIVLTPNGHPGQVRVTRRERKLIDANKQDSVTVMCDDGLRRRYPLDDLTLVEEVYEDDNC